MPIILFLLISVLSASCNGQNKSQSTHASKLENNIGVVVGDTILGNGKEIWSIYQDTKGNYWFAVQGLGVCRYDRKVLHKFTEQDGLCSNFVWTIQEDRAGNIWFGTRDGVCFFDGETFTTVNLNSVPIENISHGMLKNRKGDIYFGARDGVHHYNGISFTFIPLPLDEVDLKMRREQPSHVYTAYSVYSILEDRDGVLWFGTETKGVYRYDGNSFSQINDEELNAPIRTIYQDKKGNYWFGNNGNGLFHYDGKVLTNITKEKGLGNSEFRKSLKGKEGTLARAWTINEDNDGNLWIGTIDAGVWRYDGKKLKNYTVKDGLTSNAIWTIYKDRKGELWFGTVGGGVCKFDGKRFTPFSFK
jgi:ligand-binding sensor domain-containing protein